MESKYGVCAVLLSFFIAFQQCYATGINATQTASFSVNASKNPARNIQKNLFGISFEVSFAYSLCLSTDDIGPFFPIIVVLSSWF